MREGFGYVKNQHEEIISARCSFAYDVCNELVLDAKIDRRRSCEKELARQHLDSLDAKTDILVFDRGYPCQWLVGMLIKKGFKFCFRLSTAWKSAYEEIEKQGGDIDWTMVHRSHKGTDKLKELGIPKQIRGLRLVSITLPSGEKEVLLTNLTDRAEFSIDDIKELYNLRWGVEEAYKLLKKILHLEHFTGKSIIAVKQDFYAKVFMMNMASMIRSQGMDNSQNKRKHARQANKTQVLAKTKDFLIDLFFGGNIKDALCNMLKLLKKRMEIVRPNRSNPRPDVSSRRRLKGLNSKGI